MINFIKEIEKFIKNPENYEIFETNLINVFGIRVSGFAHTQFFISTNYIGYKQRALVIDDLMYICFEQHFINTNNLVTNDALKKYFIFYDKDEHFNNEINGELVFPYEYNYLITDINNILKEWKLNNV